MSPRENKTTVLFEMKHYVAYLEMILQVLWLNFSVKLWTKKCQNIFFGVIAVYLRIETL